MPDTQMSEADAKKEFDEIQAEIAKEKGVKDPEKKVEDEPNAEDEPKDDEDPKDPNDPGDTQDDDPEDIEPKDRRVSKHSVPLSKYQDTKKNLESERDTERTEKERLQGEVERLTQDLKSAKTSQGMAEKVKAFSEKTGMDEQAALELVQLVIGEVKPTTSTEDAQKNQKVDIFIKKQEAEESFQTELKDFLTEMPAAAEFADKIRDEAFKKENTSKSLYEIFHRFVKPSETTEDPVKKKTGESNSRTARTTTPAFDVSKVIEKMNNGVGNPLKGLTDTQIDEVFLAMEKTGSRYK